jgi:hypothetical protein
VGRLGAGGGALGPREAQRGPRWVDGALIAAAGLGLLAFTWRKWPDALVDFGRELYAPWRMAEGAWLYRDVAWFQGPLSVGWNALWFRVVGVGFGTLIASNALLLALFTALVQRTLTRLSGARAALFGTLFFLFTFAFGQTCGVGNYNYLAPYSHEAVHGLYCAFAALAALDGGAGAPGRRRAAAAGFLLGLAFLTKPEPFAAGLVGVCASVALRPAPLAAKLRSALALGLGFLVPLLAAFAWLASALSAGEAARGVLGAWPVIFAGEVSRLPFYRGPLGTGLDAPGQNLLALVISGAAFLALLALGAALGRFAPRGRAASVAIALGVLALGLAAPIPWGDAGRPLPLILVGALAALALALRRAREPEAKALFARRLAFVAFALALLAKNLLTAKLWHYGFVLAMPASLVAVMLLLDWAPAALERRGVSGAPLAALGFGVLAAVGWFYGEISAAAYARRHLELGQESDRIVADARGAFASRALEAVEAHVPAGGTLLVLPEGVLINYLARRLAPAPHLNYMPPEVLMFGEAEMLAALQAAPPDAVLLIHKDTSEYGLPLFGRDYGRTLLAWVRSRYQEVWVDPGGDPPLQPGSRLGSALLRQRE